MKATNDPRELEQNTVNIALVGCGFVADYYLSTLLFYPELKVVGITDLDAARAELLSKHYGVAIYATLSDLLADPAVEMVINLTNPASHYEVSAAALHAGKHVYSEKPFAMRMEQAVKLTQLAESRGLLVASAPCSMLSETAQTIGKILRSGTLGEVRIVYAEMDDGMVHRMPYQSWLSASGLPWPYKDEFEVGCTMEHAGYCITWLASWFGPAVSVTSFASTRIPEKIAGETLEIDSPDFSVACIQFASGVVARLTCGIVAPRDHAMKIITDGGILYTDEVWNYRAPVYSRRMIRIRRRVMLNPLRKKHKLPPAPTTKPKYKGAQAMDFARGPAEVAASIREGRPCRVSAKFSLHVNEITLAIHWAREQGATYTMTTTFDPVEPMPWAK
jgi:predicted dehydrogenase